MPDPDQPAQGEPRTEGSAESEPVQSELAERESGEHEESGLDLARRIAGQARGGRPTPKRRRGQRPIQEVRYDDGRDPQSLGDALSALMRRQGWSQTLDLHQLLGRWAELVGPVNSAHSRPEGFADGVLTVRAESTTWATSLRTMAPVLVARLNEQLGQQTVIRIVVLGPEPPSWSHGRRRVQGRGPRDTYG